MYLGSPFRHWSPRGKYQQKQQVDQWSRDQAKQEIHLAVSHHLEKQNYWWEGVWSMRVRERETSCGAMIHEARWPKSPAWEAMQSSLKTVRKAQQFAHWFSLLPQMPQWCHQQQQYQTQNLQSTFISLSLLPMGVISSATFQELGAVQTVSSKEGFASKVSTMNSWDVKKRNCCQVFSYVKFKNKIKLKKKKQKTFYLIKKKKSL